MQHLLGDLRALSFLLPSVNQLYGDAGFTFQQDLSPAHSAKGTLTGLRTRCPVFDCPKGEWVYHCGEKWETSATQCWRAEGHYQSNLHSQKTPANPQTDGPLQSCITAVPLNGTHTKNWVTILAFSCVCVSWQPPHTHYFCYFGLKLDCCELEEEQEAERGSRNRKQEVEVGYNSRTKCSCQH